LELGPNARTTVAFCASAIDGCVRVGGVVFLAALQRHAGGNFRPRRLRDDCLSALILGVALRVSIGVSRGRSGRVHQLHRQHRRIFRAEDFWRTESAHRLVQHRIRFHDRVLDRCIRAGVVMPARTLGALRLFPHLLSYSVLEFNLEWDAGLGANLIHRNRTAGVQLGQDEPATRFHLKHTQVSDDEINDS